MLNEMDIFGLWDTDPEALRIGQGPSCTDEMIRVAEQELGYKLPESYIWLVKQQNGGYLKRNNFLLDYELSGVGNRVMMPMLYGVGHEKTITINSMLGTQCLIEDWGYPNIGVGIGVGFFGAHEAFFLDYRECGIQGEPRVVHVDQEFDYRITVLAENFESFIRGLIPDPNGF